MLGRITKRKAERRILDNKLHLRDACSVFDLFDLELYYIDADVSNDIMISILDDKNHDTAFVQQWLNDFLKPGAGDLSKNG